MAPCGIDFYIFASEKNILETVPDSMRRTETIGKIISKYKIIKTKK